jgi:hypothetical protein
MRRTLLCSMLFLGIGLSGPSGFVQAAILPDFLLRPLAMQYCQAKLTPYIRGADRDALCHCAWERISQTPGERSALLQEALHPREAASLHLHWLALEQMQIRSCVSQTHLNRKFQQAERKYPKLARWMHRP